MLYAITPFTPKQEFSEVIGLKLKVLLSSLLYIIANKIININRIIIPNIRYFFLFFFGSFLLFSPLIISFISTLNISLSLFNCSISGIPLPFSHLLTACDVIDNLSAKSFWV